MGEESYEVFMPQSNKSIGLEPPCFRRSSFVLPSRSGFRLEHRLSSSPSVVGLLPTTPS